MTLEDEINEMRKRQISELKETILKLDRQLKTAQSKAEFDDSRFERMIEVAYSDNPVAFRLERIQKILREKRDKRRGLGY